MLYDKLFLYKIVPYFSTIITQSSFQALFCGIIALNAIDTDSPGKIHLQNMC